MQPADELAWGTRNVVHEAANDSPRNHPRGCGGFCGRASEESSGDRRYNDRWTDLSLAARRTENWSQKMRRMEDNQRQHSTRLDEILGLLRQRE